MAAATRPGPANSGGIPEKLRGPGSHRATTLGQEATALPAPHTTLRAEPPFLICEMESTPLPLEEVVDCRAGAGPGPEQGAGGRGRGQGPRPSPLAPVELTAVAGAALHLQGARAARGVTGDLQAERDLIRPPPSPTLEWVGLPLGARTRQGAQVSQAAALPEPCLRPPLPAAAPGWWFGGRPTPHAGRVRGACSAKPAVQAASVWWTVIGVRQGRERREQSRTQPAGGQWDRVSPPCHRRQPQGHKAQCVPQVRSTREAKPSDSDGGTESLWVRTRSEARTPYVPPSGGRRARTPPRWQRTGIFPR